VITYPYLKGGVYDETKYMVKAQGNYLVYETGTMDVVATHSAQLLAELSIDASKKQIFLKKYRIMPYQNDAVFYKYNKIIFK
jgi:ribosomal protein L25 (general stress protein Ctc)